MENTVYAKGLTKRFGSLVAVNGIDLDVGQGECFGFLGANGAGKTSTMRMISCVSPVTEGELWVNGKDVKTSARHIKEELGVVNQEDNLDSNLSVLHNLEVHARYFNIVGHPINRSRVAGAGYVRRSARGLVGIVVCRGHICRLVVASIVRYRL